MVLRPTVFLQNRQAQVQCCGIADCEQGNAEQTRHTKARTGGQTRKRVSSLFFIRTLIPPLFLRSPALFPIDSFNIWRATKRDTARFAAKNLFNTWNFLRRYQCYKSYKLVDIVGVNRATTTVSLMTEFNSQHSSKHKMTRCK